MNIEEKLKKDEKFSTKTSKFRDTKSKLSKKNSKK